MPTFRFIHTLWSIHYTSINYELQLQAIILTAPSKAVWRIINWRESVFSLLWLHGLQCLTVTSEHQINMNVGELGFYFFTQEGSLLLIAFSQRRRSMCIDGHVMVLQTRTSKFKLTDLYQREVDRGQKKTRLTLCVCECVCGGVWRGTQCGILLLFKCRRCDRWTEGGVKEYS